MGVEISRNAMKQERTFAKTLTPLKKTIEKKVEEDMKKKQESEEKEAQESKRRKEGGRR